MRTFIATTLLAAVCAASPALAEGDAAKGEKIFLKCRACHEIVAPDGAVVQRGGKVGPNLYGVIGRQAGSLEGFKGYSTSMTEAGEKGLVWDEAHFTAYVQDATGFLRDYLDDSSARGKMTFKLTSGMEDIYAYLASVAPE